MELLELEVFTNFSSDYFEVNIAETLSALKLSLLLSVVGSSSCVSVCSYILCNYMLIWYKLSHTVIAARLAG